MWTNGWLLNFWCVWKTAVTCEGFHFDFRADLISIGGWKIIWHLICSIGQIKQFLKNQKNILWNYISVRSRLRNRGKVTDKCDCISGKVEVLYSMMETQSNENVKMSSPKCYRANNTMFPTSNPVEKLVQPLLTSGGWSLYEIAKVPESFQHKVCTLDPIGWLYQVLVIHLFWKGWNHVIIIWPCIL